MVVTPASEQDREQVEKLAEAVQEVTAENVEELAYVAWGYGGEQPAEKADQRGIRLEVLKQKRPSAVLCFCREDGWWSAVFAWATRFRRLVKDYERLPQTLAGLHFVAFACLFLHRAISIIGPSP